jgi:hypothetical protein
MTGNPLTVHIERRADGDAIAGLVRDGRGKEHHFTGWLGLLSLLEETRLMAISELPSAPGPPGRRAE